MKSEDTVKHNVIYRPVNESREDSPELICPECGHHPLTLAGRKTLCMPTDRKVYCDKCIYECKY